MTVRRQHSWHRQIQLNSCSLTSFYTTRSAGSLTSSIAAFMRFAVLTARRNVICGLPAQYATHPISQPICASSLLSTRKRFSHGVCRVPVTTIE